ncbi:MAG: hypothetical protein ACOYNI_03650 [Acidimicrobiia bacterium]
MTVTMTERPDEPAPPGSGAPSLSHPLVVVAAAASGAAGLVHGAAAGTHQGDTTLVRLFAFAALVQIAWAVWAVARPSRSVMFWGAAINAAMVLAWAASRTFGLPLVDALSEVEPVGTQDLLCAVLGAGAALFAGAAALGLRLPRWSFMMPVALLSVTALAFFGAVAPHQHSHSHDHAHSDAAAASDGHTHSHGSAMSTDPIVSISDPRLTATQRAAAQKLLDESRAALRKFPDQSSIEAAGYRSIGDSVTGFEHFVNPQYLVNADELDPNQIESIVMQVNPDGTKTTASAMYILARGKTMADVPEIAGSLTTFHDHQNLCWDPSGLRVVGVVNASGQCSRGVFRPTAPMLHVWATDTPCGPFSGIEGHGGDCKAHSHGPVN